ncbi:GNAT family N-acetyltransferase [Conexibacter sp. W3-3-2]|uniref:GNAT family N-acetyltransferase n=1 Tax=Paraconexibacter algicola TaxID=2133960 RepID=A0A2T4UIL0_9ACTN|nr:MULTISPECIES: GNAT family N-acetyltransferase [Solirubrobacterales]MTD45371.1 GNAT family N-acetyltransferase [Conexibacter sp. W3-3-2]PTL59062.1 GNAT family N-acetyltransferase [Paraconexibacter algicola]
MEISADKDRLDRDVIHRFLSEEAYWSIGVPRERVDRAIDHSLCFGAYDDDGAQVGFTRVVTDYATFGWVCDVFVLPAARGRGVARALIAAVVAHEQLRDVRRLMLATEDAHGLYEQHGFTKPDDLYKWMVRRP